ncbi:hypothetical protein B0H10DRAFT_1188347 [Mycena sp. CBHHK59/15]|nr:hypothetical protein B0H10DRAFT_1188347 [Mycena sp. CBHHK59/15]
MSSKLLSKLLTAVVTTVVRVIPISFHPSLSAHFNTQSLKAYDSAFGPKELPAYSLYHKEEDNKSFDLSCVGCGAAVIVTFIANFEGNFADGFTEANMKVQLDVDVTFVLGIHTNFKYEDNKDLLTIDAFVPSASIVIPGLVEIGPAVGFAVGAGYSINLDGLFSAGYTCSWKEVGGQLDLLDPKQSKIIGDWGLGTNCKQVLDAEVTATLNVEAYAKLSLKLKVSVLAVLTTKLTGEVALTEKLSLVLTTSLSTKADKCPSLVPYLSASLQSLLYLSLTNLDDVPLHEPFTYEIFGLCLSISNGGALMLDATNGNTSIGAGSNSPHIFIEEGKPDSDAQDSGPNSVPGDPAVIYSVTDDTVLDWDTDGRCVVKDQDVFYAGWRALQYKVFATSAGQALYLDPSMTSNNATMGELSLKNETTSELTPLIIALPPNSTYVVVLDDVKDVVYYFVGCNYDDGNTRMFLTTDPESGVAPLQSETTITGAGVVSCDLAFFNITVGKIVSA